MTDPKDVPPASGGFRFRAHGRTDVGKVREENQDSFSVLEAGAGAAQGEVLAVIADGMGGLAGGGTASRIVVESVVEMFRRGGPALGDVLREGVREANSRIHTQSAERLEGEPMGSTVTAFAARGTSAWIAHVGDSRAYRIPPAGPLARLTRDHTWVEELSRRGAIEPGSLQYALHRNVLTRGVGLRPEVEVDLVAVNDVSPGDVFVLCSDGLHEVVRDAEIEVRVRQGGSLDSIAAELIALAVERGGPDNITVLAVRAEADAAAASADASTASSRRWFPRNGFMPLSLFIAFALGVACVLVLEDQPRDSGSHPGDPLETLLEETLSRDLQKTPEERKLRDAIEELRSARARRAAAGGDGKGGKTLESEI